MSKAKVPNKIIGLEITDYKITEDDVKQENREHQEICALVEKRHSAYCAQRQIWRDGECECLLHNQRYNPYAWQDVSRYDKLKHVYSERNYTVILAAKIALKLGFKAGRGIDNNEDWNLEWRHVVYIELPCGTQLSWHMSPKEVVLLDTLPQYNGKWDGKQSAKTPNFISEIN